jgi:hypothetical protein
VRSGGRGSVRAFGLRRLDAAVEPGERSAVISYTFSSFFRRQSAPRGGITRLVAMSGGLRHRPGFRPPFAIGGKGLAEDSLVPIPPGLSGRPQNKASADRKRVFRQLVLETPVFRLTSPTVLRMLGCFGSSRSARAPLLVVLHHIHRLALKGRRVRWWIRDQDASDRNIVAVSDAAVTWGDNAY